MRLIPNVILFIFVSPLFIYGQEKLTLNQIVNEAVEKNAALLAERANITIAEARVFTARLRPNPVLSVSTNHLDLLGTGFNDQNGGGPSEITAHTDFTWERGNKRRARTEAARAAKSVVERQFQNALRLAILSLENAFVDVLLAKDTLVLAKQNAASFVQIVQINEARLKAGDIAQVEFVRTRLASLQLDNSALQATLRLRQSLAQLQTLMGRKDISPSFDVIGELRNDSTLPSLAEVRQSAFEQRPDLLALAAEERRAQAEHSSQVAQGKADFTLGTEYTRQQYNAKANSLGFSIEVPLPFFNRNQGEIARAREEQKQAAFRQEAQKASISGEVMTAYLQAQAARSLLENIETKMLQHAREIREITEFSYKHGGSTLLELLDAQKAFNDTMQAYNEARSEYARSLYLLDATSGTARTQ